MEKKSLKERVTGKAKKARNKLVCVAGGAMCAMAANPALAMAAYTAKEAGKEEMDKLTDALSTIATAGGILCIFAALVLFALSKVGDSGSARGEGAMVGLALAGVAFFIASAFIKTALNGILG